jgi:predicted permease
MYEILQDARYALRMLAKQPGFTAVALITLALGIGANTAIFSVVYSVLLKPLPFGEPERLVQIWESRPDRGWRRASGTEANFWDFRELNRSFEDLGAVRATGLNLTGWGFPERLRAGQISAGFFRILRVQPVLGRTFLPEESEPGEDNRVVLLGNEIWRSHFGADSAIVGKLLTLDGENYRVVGILPAGEPWLNRAAVYVPLVHDPEAGRVSFELEMIGRLAPSVSIEAARADLEAVARQLEERYPEVNAGIGIDLAPSSDWVASDTIRRALWVLLGAVVFLLMIACVNLTNLLMAKAISRQKETALRSVLGAGQGRIARQMLTESLLLSFLGAGLGILLGNWVIHLVRVFDPGGIPRLTEVVLNKWVLGFTLTAALLTGIFSGLIPVLQSLHTNIVVALRTGDRNVAGDRRQKRSRSGLVAIEVALSLTLLVGSGLLIRSFYQLLQVDRGFQSENRLLASVSLPRSYDRQRTRTFLEQFLARVSSVPQIRGAAAVSSRPIVGGNTGLGIVAAEKPDPDGGVPWASWRLITPGYFRAMGIPLLKGRTFTEQDEFTEGKPLRVVISKRLAELLWPGEEPIGRQAIFWRGQDDLPGEIVGVVGNMRERGLETDPTLAVYFPYYGLRAPPVNLVVQTTSLPEEIVPTLRSIISELDPNLPVSNVRNMDEIVNDSVSARRFNMLMMAVFAGVALLLALAGIYGVQSYTVARRTSEIGIRVALGASGGSVVRHIVGQGMRTALLGIGLGLLGALGISRLLSGLLFEIAPSDPTTYFGVTLILSVTAFGSCYLPALRALHVDPAVTLREE